MHRLLCLPYKCNYLTNEYTTFLRGDGDCGELRLVALLRIQMFWEHPVDFCTGI